MKKKLTPRQMINVELAARAANKKSTKALKHHIPAEERQKLKIAFNCECADPACRQRILLTLKEYEDLHKNFARFIVAKGHTEPRIEKVKASRQNLTVVDKYALS